MYHSKICPICNQEFQPQFAKQKYCKRPVELTCSVCGDTYIGQCSPDNVTVCNKPECKKKAASVGATNKTKICRICGQPFHPNSSRQLDCNRPVTKVCVLCGKEYIGKCSQNDLSSTCSDECRIKYASQQSMKAVSRVSTRTCMLCGKEFHPVNNTQIICKDDHFRTCEVCGKEFKLDTRYNSREWATTCSRNCSAILANRNKTDETIARIIEERRADRYKDNPDKLENYNMFLKDPRGYILSRYSKDNPATIYKLCDDFLLHNTTVGALVEKYGLRDLLRMKTSTMEQEIMRFIESVSPDIKIVHNTRKIITPYELDIYLPDYNFAIECNPTATHNSTNHPFEEDALPTPEKYHKMKTDMCEEKGIFLLHVFGYDWANKKEIIKSIICNAIRQDDKVYARNCVIKEVNSSEARLFLDENHRQGHCGSSVRIGLYHQDKLVSLMTFGTPRRGIGNNSQQYELLRFCSCKYMSVVGGASKLFKYFIRTYNPSSVISYSDRAHTTGNIYKVLGFNEICRSDANYRWVEEKTDKDYHRINAQKQNIKQFLKDDTIDLSETEVKIMSSHGYVQVFDSGTITWEWRKD